MTTSAVDHQGPGAVPDWTLGWRISRALDFGSVSNKQLAEEFEMNPATISRWIGDKGAPPKAIYLRQIALRCGVSYEWLATGANPQPTPEHGAGAHIHRYLHRSRSRRALAVVPDASADSSTPDVNQSRSA